MSQSDNPIVLMYHGITGNGIPLPNEREPGADLYDVAKENLAAHFELILKKEMKSRVILTFDDGELSTFENGLPLLKQYGLKGYFFITVNRIGKNGYMDWEELYELRDCGMTVGSHGLHHKILTKCSKKELEEELADSKALLEQHLMINVDCLSVPRGLYNKKIIDTARDCGYKKIFVSEALEKDVREHTPRIAVRKSWTLSRFEQALLGQTPAHEIVVNSIKKAAKHALGHGGYDWIRRMILKKRKRA